MDSSHFDSIAQKLVAGDALSELDISELSSTTNLLRLGALALPAVHALAALLYCALPLRDAIFKK